MLVNSGLPDFRYQGENIRDDWGGERVPRESPNQPRQRAKLTPKNPTPLRSAEGPQSHTCSINRAPTFFVRASARVQN